MSELGPEARNLIESAARGDEPSDADRQRMRQRLALELGAAALATTTAVATSSAVSASSAASAIGASAAGSAKSGFLAGLAKLALAAGLAGAVGTAAVITLPSRPAPESETSRSVQHSAPPHETAVPKAPIPAPVAVPSEAREEQAAEPATNSAPTAARTFRTSPERRPARAGQSSLKAEVALLARAQQALRADAPQRALALAREHAARFPNGGLSQERAGVEALSRCALGQDGNEVLAEFTRQSPASPLLARVRAACRVK